MVHRLVLAMLLFSVDIIFVYSAALNGDHFLNWPFLSHFQVISAERTTALKIPSIISIQYIYELKQILIVKVKFVQV